jgi:hypothetical protein
MLWDRFNENKRTMDKETWQRLRNLSLFKLWVTDKQLSRLWPVAMLIALIVLLLTVLGHLFR